MFTKFIESYSFFKIVLSPLLIGSIVGFALYQYFEQDQTGAVLFGVCILLGLIIGIIWAVRVTRKYGAHHFISRVDASEDVTEAVSKKKK
jgi:ABC-type transport system involved in cytochrome c biogenesis permease subunit